MYASLISAHQLSQLTDVFIIDVRHDLMQPDAGRAAHQTAHIAGAHFLHLDEDLSSKKTGHNGRHPLPDLRVLAQTLQQKGLNAHTQVAVYDANNAMMAARAWWLLRHMGHEAVAVLDGGFDAWQKTHGPTESGCTAAPKTVGNFVAQPSLNTAITAEQLMTHLHDGTQLVIDARAPERFSGAVEPMDPVGGHIPHARNFFFMHNLNQDLTFKTPEALKELWQPFFQQPATLINQCGSGVTACHNILAQHIAGFKNATLYAGSWSEWCSDPLRPVEHGDDLNK